MARRRLHARDRKAAKVLLTAKNLGKSDQDIAQIISAYSGRPVSARTVAHLVGKAQRTLAPPTRGTRR